MSIRRGLDGNAMSVTRCRPGHPSVSSGPAPSLGGTGGRGPVGKLPTGPHCQRWPRGSQSSPSPSRGPCHRHTHQALLHSSGGLDLQGVDISSTTPPKTTSSHTSAPGRYPGPVHRSGRPVDPLQTGADEAQNTGRFSTAGSIFRRTSWPSVGRPRS